MGTGAEKVRRYRDRRRRGLHPMIVAVNKAVLEECLTEVGLLPHDHNPDEIAPATERLLELVLQERI
jgi:hypothetical protein